MLTNDIEREEIKKNYRIKIIGLVLTLILLCLEARLYKIMIIGNYFAAKKINQQIYKPVIYYDGFEFIGDIFDRNLKKLTNDGVEYKAIILPQIVWGKLASSRSEYVKLLGLMCIDESNISLEELTEKIKEEYMGSQKAIVLTINKNLMDEINNLSLPGIYTKEEKRKYVDNTGRPVISNFLSNTINTDDLKYEDSIDMTVFNYISRYNKRILKIPVDAKGKSLPGLSTLEEIETEDMDDAPKSIVLTIDYDIQRIAEEVLNELCENNGAVSIINVKTGEVLAMASKDKNGWERNMVTYSGKDYAYNPGSVFKIIVLAAALEEGLVNMDTKFFCSGKSSVNGISCYKTTGHGNIGLEDAFALSCNVYFIELAKIVGPEKIISMAERFGFGEKVLDFSKESKGMLFKNLSDIKYDIGNIAIGQKDIMVTPIQVCNMISTIANDGVRNKPYILKKVLKNNGDVYKEYRSNKDRVISKQTAATIKSLLNSVVEKGTGRNAQISEGAAGKTGTPQRGSKTSSGRYEYEDEWFTGYFPSYEPEYGISVYIEDTGNYIYEKNKATSVFKSIAEKILLLNR